MVMVALPQSDTTTPYIRLGRRLAELREAAGLSQRQLAPLIHVSVTYPSQMEAGKFRPDAEVLRRIATVLNADYEELAVLAKWVDAPRGTVHISVPPEEAADTRWYAALPAETKALIRRLGQAVIREARITLYEEAPKQEPLGDRLQQNDGDQRESTGAEPPPSTNAKRARRTKRGADGQAC